MHRACDDQAVHAPFEQRAHLLELARRIALAAMDQQRVAGEIETTLDRRDGPAKHRVGDGRHDETDRPRSARDQGSRHLIGNVVEGRERPLDRILLIRGDQPRIVEHPRDRGDRYAGDARDILDRRLAGARSALALHACLAQRWPLCRAAILLHVPETAEQIVAGCDRGMPRRVVGGLTGRQAGDRGVIVHVEESRDGVALLAGTVHHAVEVRTVDVVGPALEQVADIDDQRARDERRADPLTVPLLQF